MRIKASTVQRPVQVYELHIGSYTNLHELYHMMLDLSRSRSLSPIEQAFFAALKVHV